MESNNKLIAKFMGVNVITLDDVRKNKNPYFSSADGYLEDEMRYHTSWDWLMPVVEKIESLRDTNGNAYRFTIDMCNAQIEGTTIEVSGGSYKRDATYQAVVEFIKTHKDETKV